MWRCTCAEIERERSRVLAQPVFMHIYHMDLSLPSRACIKYQRDALEKLGALHSSLPFCQMMLLFVKTTLLCEAVCTLHTNLHHQVIYPAFFSP